MPTFGHPRWHVLFRHFAHKWAPRWQESCSHHDFLPSLGTPQLKMTITDQSPRVLHIISRHFSFRATVRLAWYCCPSEWGGGVKASPGRPRPRVCAAFPAGLGWAWSTRTSGHPARRIADSPWTQGRRQETPPCLYVSGEGRTIFFQGTAGSGSCYPCFPLCKRAVGFRGEGAWWHTCSLHSWLLLGLCVPGAPGPCRGARELDAEHARGDVGLGPQPPRHEDKLPDHSRTACWHGKGGGTRHD